MEDILLYIEVTDALLDEDIERAEELIDIYTERM